jgi:hypothetical protein
VNMLSTLPILAASLVQAPAAREPLKLSTYPQLMATQYTTVSGLPASEVVDARIVGGKVTVLTKSGAVARQDDRWVAVDGSAFAPPSDLVTVSLPPGAKLLQAARTRTGDVWAITSAGSFRQAAGKLQPLDIPKAYKFNQPMPNIESTIRCLIQDRSGYIWLGTDCGVIVTDGNGWWRQLDRQDAMPYEDILCVSIAPNGDLWGGTTQGAWRLRAGQWRYFWGKRWMPGNRVNAIACADDGAVWLATDAGVSNIEERRIRLSDKAAHYEEITAARHNRRGWVTSSTLIDKNDPSKGAIYEASDNDGLWTALYVAAESYRYGATKDPNARELAKKSMNALLDLVRLSGYPGFPARAIIEKGEKVTGCDPTETVRVAGETDLIWYTPAGHANLLCKGDTSSDEMDGHYFAWFVYYNLVADEAEKKEIRAVVKAVTDNIVQHDLTLVGHTGRKTRWGVWGPQWLNDDPRWQGDRGLNSTGILAYLKVAQHICNDPTYERVYEDLIAKHHYLTNTMEYRRHYPWYRVNHSDDELAYCEYYPLLQLETRPERRAILFETIGETWRAIRTERGPFYNFIYGAATGASCNVEDAVTTLQDWPWDLRYWEQKNSHRTDVTIRRSLGPQRQELDRVLPASERRPFRWNSNPFEPDSGGDGTEEEDGASWLLPYWMARYHGFIAE